MSPAPKRSKRKAAAEAEAEATTSKKKGKGKGRKGKSAPVAEDEDEDEDKPKRGRAGKDYGVTGEQISEMREEGMSWQEIQDEVGAKSAIPLRNLMNKFLAESDEELAIDPDDGDAIVEARDEEALGWGQIAARTGLGVAEVKKAYVEAGGEHVDQRAYKDKDGNVHFGGAQAGNGATADNESDDDESEYDDMSRADLIAELKERGLSTKGKTPALIERLQEDDASDEDEDDEDEPEPEPTPKAKKGKKDKGKKAKAGR